jgi:hypothetical protein
MVTEIFPLSGLVLLNEGHGAGHASGGGVRAGTGGGVQATQERAAVAPSKAIRKVVCTAAP